MWVSCFPRIIFSTTMCSRLMSLFMHPIFVIRYFFKVSRFFQWGQTSETWSTVLLYGLFCGFFFLTFGYGLGWETNHHRFITITHSQSGWFSHCKYPNLKNHNGHSFSVCWTCFSYYFDRNVINLKPANNIEDLFPALATTY